MFDQRPGRDIQDEQANIYKTALGVLLTLWIAACSSIGPGTVPRDRVDYVNAIGNSWERETLLNIVKLRYGHAPIFLSITQVVSGYQLQSTLSALWHLTLHPTQTFSASKAL